MKTDLYQLLRVKRNASRESILKAFRQRSRETHPDRGGTQEDFEAVKMAYKILSDDARRSKYDATGEIDPQVPDNSVTEVLGIVSHCLQQLIVALAQKGIDPKQRNLVDMMRKMLTEKLAEARVNEKNCETVAQVLSSLSGRFKTDEESNPLEEVLRAHVAQMTAQKESIKREIDRIEKALAFLKKYRFDMDKRAFGLAASVSTSASISSMFFGGTTF